MPAAAGALGPPGLQLLMDAVEIIPAEQAFWVVTIEKVLHAGTAVALRVTREQHEGVCAGGGSSCGVLQVDEAHAACCGGGSRGHDGCRRRRHERGGKSCMEHGVMRGTCEPQTTNPEPKTTNPKP